jgi:hypothetical protein
MKGVLSSCCTKIKEKIVMEEMNVSQIHGDGKVEQCAWRRDPRNCRLGCRAPIPIYVFMATAAGLNIFVGGPRYGAMDPTKGPTPFGYNLAIHPLTPQKKHLHTHFPLN